MFFIKKMSPKILNVIFIFVMVTSSHCELLGEDDFADDALEDEFGKIIHTSVIFRHGNRTPYAPYPFDPYKDLEWSEGIGHLTNAGKQMMYNLGKWFRIRYSIFIGDRYYYQDIKMESSDFDRTIMSALCVLAGMYPPSEFEQWDENGIQWQPVPVHTIPLEYDNILLKSITELLRLEVATSSWNASDKCYNNGNCEVYNHELFLANTDPKMVEMFHANQDFFNYVGMSTGIMFNENFIVLGLLKLMEVYDTLNVQKQNLLELPFWCHSVYPEPMNTLALKLFDLGTNTEKMRRLKAGPVLKSILEDINRKIAGDFEQTMHFYSGHDSTIATVMIALNIFNNHLPPYGSALIFELRQKNKEHFVTVLYRNDTTRPPYVLQIPNCKSPCSLYGFINLIIPFIPQDWNEECKLLLHQEPDAHFLSGIYTSTFDDSILTLGQVTALIGVVIFLSSTILYFSIKRRLCIFQVDGNLSTQNRLKCE